MNFQEFLLFEDAPTPPDMGMGGGLGMGAGQSPLSGGVPPMPATPPMGGPGGPPMGGPMGMPPMGGPAPATQQAPVLNKEADVWKILERILDGKDNSNPKQDQAPNPNAKKFLMQ